MCFSYGFIEIIIYHKCFSNYQNFRKSFAKYQNFRALRALQNLPQCCFYYQYFLIATPGEAQQQKFKAVYELPVKRLAFQEACRFVGQFRVSRCRWFFMKIFLMKKLGALRAHALRFALHLMTIMNTWNLPGYNTFRKNRDTSSNICRALHRYWIFQSNL